MRFKCGKTEEERLAALKARADASASASLTEWHPYFLWWPTALAEGQCAWLETVERRLMFSPSSTLMYKFYRPLGQKDFISIPHWS